MAFRGLNVQFKVDLYMVCHLSFAAIVLTRPHRWFVEGIKCSRLTAVHFACLWNCNGFTVVKSNYGCGERKQRFMADRVEGIFEPSRTCSSSIDMELNFRHFTAQHSNNRCSTRNMAS